VVPPLARAPVTAINGHTSSPIAELSGGTPPRATASESSPVIVAPAPVVRVSRGEHPEPMLSRTWSTQRYVAAGIAVPGIGVLAVACSVDRKQPLSDGGVDTPGDTMPPSGTPDTTITLAPPEFSNRGAATFEFTSTDPKATFACSIDGETPVTCTTPYTRVLA